MTKVVSDAAMVLGATRVLYPEFGLCIVGPLTHPVHYYALFGNTDGENT